MATARKNSKSNRRVKRGKKKPGPLLLVLCLIVIIAVAFFVTESRHEKGKSLPLLPPRQVEHYKLPPHESRESEPAAPTVHEDYTGTVVHPPEHHALPSGSGGRGVVAIIIDDMGKSVQQARSLVDIGVPLTFSIIPGLAKDRQVAGEARQQGIEVMIHLPMEPKGYPAQRLEENGLLLAQSDQEIESRLTEFLREIPQAIGANNHMGSSFTENREKMAVVLKVLKGKGLFFVDSKTSPASVGYDLAKELGVRSASRNVFLDNIQQSGYIAKQLQQTVAIARKRGSAIAICHPHPVTIQTLAAELPRLRDEGITFVPVSQLVH